MKAFKELTTADEVRNYLLGVLSRTGKRKLEHAELYHYTDINSIKNIISTKYIWLGAGDNMNDFFEGEMIKSAKGKGVTFFSSFSKAEENLAMYKMYAPSPNGAMMKISYKGAKNIIESISVDKKTELDKVRVRIVRDTSLTEEYVDAEVYWSAVAYKDLHTNMLRVGESINNNIDKPFDIEELAGLIKLYGWEYEKEVRLCATVKKPLKPNERIAISIPKDVKISVVLGPGFDRNQNISILSAIKRKGIAVHESEYDAFVDLGYDELDEIKELRTIIYNYKNELLEKEKNIEQLREENKKYLKDEDVEEMLQENSEEIYNLNKKLDVVVGYSHAVSDQVKKLVAESLGMSEITWIKHVTDFLQKSITSLEEVLGLNYGKMIRVSLKLTKEDKIVKTYVRGKNNIESRGGKYHCEDLNLKEICVEDNYAYTAIVQRKQKCFAAGNLMDLRNGFEEDDYFYCEYGDDYYDIFVATIVMPVRIPNYVKGKEQEILGLVCVDCNEEMPEWSEKYDVLCNERGYHILADYADSIAMLMKEVAHAR